jgi:hypothetical protein
MCASSSSEAELNLCFVLRYESLISRIGGKGDEYEI